MTLKRRLKYSVNRAAALSGLLRACERRGSRGLTVLMYHRVLPYRRCIDYPLSSLVIPAEVFEQQLKQLTERYRILPLGQALAATHGGGHDRPLLAITFDDGYADNHEIAAKILDRAGARATFFATTGFVGGDGLMWFDRAVLALGAIDGTRANELARELHTGDQPSPPGDAAELSEWMAFLKQCLPDHRAKVLAAVEQALASAPDCSGFKAMSPQQLADLQSRGHEIGSHTVNHELMPKLGDQALRFELNSSRAKLAEWLGQTPSGFCYPNGDYDERVVAAVKAAGYDYACVTRPGINGTNADRFQIKRRDITMRRVTDAAGRHDALAFRAEVSGFQDALRSLPL